VSFLENVTGVRSENDVVVGRHLFSRLPMMTENALNFAKDPVTHFLWFYFINMMLKLRFVNIVSSNKHYL
jgi:hypothetical protein